MHSAIKQNLRMVNFTGMAAVALLAAGAVFFGVLPLLKQGREAVSEAARLRGEIVKLDALDVTLKQVEEQRAKTEDRLKAVEKRLPVSSDTNTFIKELSKLTESAGIRVDGTQYPKDLRDEGRYRSLPVEVIGSGDWESCCKFLAGLRSMDRITRLDALTLEVDKDTQNQNPKNPNLRIVVNFSTFFMAR